MKVRLEHNIKNDHYTFKQAPRINERDEFYNSQKADRQKDIKNQYTNMPIDKIIHGKMQPLPEPAITNPKDKDQYKQLFK